VTERGRPLRCEYPEERQTTGDKGAEERACDRDDRLFPRSARFIEVIDGATKWVDGDSLWGAAQAPPHDGVRHLVNQDRTHDRGSEDQSVEAPDDGVPTHGVSRRKLKAGEAERGERGNEPRYANGEDTSADAKFWSESLSEHLLFPRPNR
jgi:hypothetical protein